MDIINILPDSVANQIAAGEVVDRPAGAVKELLENAMDAGATQIDLVVKDAGRTLIQVVDNGCGMSDSDARLCFERHATSKIHHADDLFAIHTMGFRGEALASIAAIAQVELRTRQYDSELGTTVVIEGSNIVSQQPTACPTGTSLMVKNLFFNVPARRNFLKKDSVEMGHIEEVFRRITLIHYDIGFTLTSNGKLLYSLPAGSLLQRIAGLFGSQYKERMYAVDEETDLVRIHGFVSRPEYTRSRRGEQYLFVNGRYIKHPGLSTAVERAYADLLPERAYPSYFIGLQVDPSRIDVNIHPTKTEVKFADESALFAILRSAVKRALGQFSLATELSFDTPEEFNIGPAPTDYMPPQPRISYNPDYNPFRSPTPSPSPKGEGSRNHWENPHDAISVTNAPGLIGALLVGVGFAKGLSFSSCKPLVPVHHIRGHVAAAYLTHHDLTPPFIALIVSGGHSHLVYVSDYTSYKILGGTRDDAAGESFDKAARVLGLGYPGGPKMDALAKLGDPDSIYFPRVHFHDAPFDFSFSGVKTSIINYVHNAEQTGKELNKPDVAASFSKAICEILTEKAVFAVNYFNLPQKKLVVAGGVAANSMLRKMISEEADKNGITLYIPDIPLCGDNGAMIASQGYYEYCSGNIASSDLNAFATESIEL